MLSDDCKLALKMNCLFLFLRRMITFFIIICFTGSLKLYFAVLHIAARGPRDSDPPSPAAGQRLKYMERTRERERERERERAEKLRWREGRKGGEVIRRSASTYWPACMMVGASARRPLCLCVCVCVYLCVCVCVCVRTHARSASVCPCLYGPVMITAELGNNKSRRQSREIDVGSKKLLGLMKSSPRVNWKFVFGTAAISFLLHRPIWLYRNIFHKLMYEIYCMFVWALNQFDRESILKIVWPLLPNWESGGSL